MSLIRVPKFLKFLVNLLFISIFTFVAYNFFVSGNIFNGVIFSVAVVVSFGFLTKEVVVNIKKKSMFNKEVLDKFIIERIKTSLSLSYLYLITHLSISIFASKANDFAAFKVSVTFALLVSFIIFMFSQIFQAFIYSSKDIHS